MVVNLLASVSRVIIRHLVIRRCFQKCFQHLFYNFNSIQQLKHSTNDALDCLIRKFRSKKVTIC